MDIVAETGMMFLWLGAVGLILFGGAWIWKLVCRLFARRRRNRHGGPLLSTSDIRGRTVIIKIL